MARLIQVEIYANPDDLSQVSVVFASGDGEDLTAQEMLDAFSEALIVNDVISCDIVPLGSFDA